MIRALLLVVSVLGSEALAAQQLLPTKTLLAKNPSSGTRKILWKASEAGSVATVMGDPTVDGATLRVVLTPGGDQCVTMPSAGWSAIGSIGFRYKDPALANGPVRVAQIKKTPSGTMRLKVLLRDGGPTAIAVVPGNPTGSYATNFTLGVGDDYCGGTAGATPSPNDAGTFKVSNDGAPPGCATACNATTSSTSSSSTSTTSTTLPLCDAVVSGFCWAFGDAGADCDGTCAAHARVYDTATASYAGSEGTDANCEAVAHALNPGAAFVGPANCPFALGCMYLVGSGNFRCTTPATTASASAGTVQRFCACQ